MPADSKTAAATPPKSKPLTRGSIRQSLNLASMSKALADVMSKDKKDGSKQARKSKEMSSRRSSVLSFQPPPMPPPAAPRASMGDVRPPSQVGKQTGTPESKTITRRRVSASYARSSSDEQQQSRPQDPGTPQSGVPAKSATTRPKNAIATTSSALPKYRPKSNINDPPPPKPPSPVKAGTRRRLSSSEDERRDQNMAISTSDKSSRPISPLPHRAALKNLNSLNVTPPSTPSKTKAILPSSPASRLSPARPTKIVKMTASSGIPRPPSSNSSLHPQTTPKSTRIATPKTSENRGKFPSSHTRNVSKSGGTPSRMAPSPYSRDSPSPLARQSRQSSKTTPNSSSNMSQISEASSESEDSDLENVELLLAPVASMGAPTPAMPRIRVLKKRDNPQTPTRSRLPTREDLSYVSPDPPGSNKSLRPHLRPPNSEAPRGSILSWEQLAADASRTMGEDEFRMLADIPAPFRSGAPSPSLSSQLGLPDSPGLSVIDSPGGGYGSISQVLLPDVTPSPAVSHNVQQHKFLLASDASKSVVDSSTVTLLRLQLAAMESTAKERLVQMQAMEEEIHNIKQSHAHQIEEMQKQLRFMESQSRANDDRTSKMFKASLDERLHQQRIAQEGAFQQTMLKFQENAKVSHHRVLDIERMKMTAVSSANLAASKWGEVVGACEVELDLVRADRAMLGFLLTQVDQMSAPLKV